MCHHIHSQKLGGVIATPKAEALVDAFTGQSTYQSSELIANNTCTLIPPTQTEHDNSKHSQRLESFQKGINIKQGAYIVG